MRMGVTHFLMKRLPKVATEMSLHVLAYNLTRVMNVIGVKPLHLLKAEDRGSEVPRRADYLDDLAAVQLGPFLVVGERFSLGVQLNRGAHDP
jgi:hypothetical protein